MSLDGQRGLVLAVLMRKLHCSDCERKHLQVVLQLEKIVFRYVFYVFIVFCNEKLHNFKVILEYCYGEKSVDI